MHDVHMQGAYTHTKCVDIDMNSSLRSHILNADEYESISVRLYSWLTLPPPLPLSWLPQLSHYFFLTTSMHYSPHLADAVVYVNSHDATDKTWCFRPILSRETIPVMPPSDCAPAVTIPPQGKESNLWASTSGYPHHQNQNVSSDDELASGLSYIGSQQDIFDDQPNPHAYSHATGKHSRSVPSVMDSDAETVMEYTMHHQGISETDLTMKLHNT